MTEETLNRSALIRAEQEDAIARAVRVSCLLKKSATLWLEVAREVTEAKNTLSKSGFELFLEKASLSQSIADKMPRIAEASILYLDESKTHLEKLEGWTTLYEVSKLPEPNVREMYKELERNPDQALTRSFIQQFKPINPNAPKPPINVATITLSEDDLQRIDYNELDRFKSDLISIQRIIDASIVAAGMRLNSKALERVEDIVSNADCVDLTVVGELQEEDSEVESLPERVIQLFPPSAIDNETNTF